MKRIILIYILTLNILSLASCDSKQNVDGQDTIETTNNNNASLNDKQSDIAELAVDITNSNLLEIELSKIAVDRGTNKEVRDFAQKMLEDYTKINDELKEIAQRKNIALPDSLTAGNRETFNRISNLSGNEFDKEYMSEISNRHKDNISDFEELTKIANDKDLENFASRHLLTLKTHKAMSDHREKMANESNTSSIKK